jgi:hypothetical protein
MCTQSTNPVPVVAPMSPPRSYAGLVDIDQDIDEDIDQDIDERESTPWDC